MPSRKKDSSSVFEFDDVDAKPARKKRGKSKTVAKKTAETTKKKATLAKKIAAAKGTEKKEKK